jgi:hypothetical protein
VRATPFVAVFGFPVSSGGGVLTARVQNPLDVDRLFGEPRPPPPALGAPTTTPPQPQSVVAASDSRRGDVGAGGYAASDAVSVDVHAAAPRLGGDDCDDSADDDGAQPGVQLVLADQWLQHGGATAARNPLYTGGAGAA